MKGSIIERLSPILILFLLLDRRVHFFAAVLHSQERICIAESPPVISRSRASRPLGDVHWFTVGQVIHDRDAGPTPYTVPIKNVCASDDSCTPAPIEVKLAKIASYTHQNGLQHLELWLRPRRDVLEAQARPKEFALIRQLTAPRTIAIDPTSLQAAHLRLLL